MVDILKNIKHYIFGRPSLKSLRTDEEGQCHYCGATDNWTRYTKYDNIIICDGCKLKVIDIVLKKELSND